MYLKQQRVRSALLLLLDVPVEVLECPSAALNCVFELRSLFQEQLDLFFSEYSLLVQRFQFRKHALQVPLNIVVHLDSSY